jgi:carboxymethylenebutenolidase
VCDARTFADQDELLRQSGGMTRREFGVLTLGAGLSILWPGPASAAEVVEAEVEIATPDGKADAYFVHPASGSHPGVLVWPDAFGLRPALRQMGKRLAQSGYSVLVVNPYYRTARAPILPEGADFNDPKTRETILSKMATLGAQTHRTDAEAFVDHLAAQASVARARKMGTMGYCMGGAIALRTAAARPDRIGAVASFHGGRLVTKEADSPHLGIATTRAHYLIAIAANDDEAEPEVKNVLRDVFARAGLPAEVEVYAGALHGWCPPDSRVYHEAQAERAWSRLLAIFEKALQAPA